MKKDTNTNKYTYETYEEADFVNDLTSLPTHMTLIDEYGNKIYEEEDFINDLMNLPHKVILENFEVNFIQAEN